ncbi:MAG TPA: radical SAM protein [Blastocatellia bacterium]|nr:radical SAM protein [Blastocatellia bacterium]
MPNSTKRRLVLFNPSPWPNMPYFGLPLPLLAISTLPREAGYPITIVVEDVDDDPDAQVLEACEDALLFGITSLTGHMIGRGLRLAAKVRERFPDLPIIWGGTHPSIAPDQTVAHELVDIVVAGQGEATFMDLVDAIDTGRPLDDVKGILFKRDGAIVKTGPRPTIDIDSLPPLPFDLLDVERFIMLHSSALDFHLHGKRAVTYYSSYGCPFSCSFCSEPQTSNRRWFSRSPEKVIEDLKTLRFTYNVDAVIFEDPILFVDVRRVRRIAEMMIENDLNIVWTGSSRLEAIKKIDAETWDVLKRSGIFQIFIGIESASPTVLKAVGKKYTADDIVEVSRILYEQGVTLSCSFIQGIPVEADGRSLHDIGREDLKLTSDVIRRMAEVNPKAGVGVCLYTPYPGSVAYDLSLKHGLKAPERLEDWCEFQHFENQVPWMLPEQVHFAKSNPISMKALRGKDAKRFRRNKAKGAILYAYSAITRARYRHGYFKYALEQKLMGMLAKKVMASRKPDKQINGYIV